MGNDQNKIRPSHYCDGKQYEPRKVISDWGLNFNLGNAIKYISRAGLKENEKKEDDIRKAIQYLKFELEDLFGKFEEEPLLPEYFKHIAERISDISYWYTEPKKHAMSCTYFPGIIFISSYHTGLYYTLYTDDHKIKYSILDIDEVKMVSDEYICKIASETFIKLFSKITGGN